MDAIHKVLRSNVKNNLINGIVWSIGFNFVTPFIPVLAAQMGATNNDYALLSSIPALLTILITLPASFILDRFRKQKRIISGTIIFSRLCYFLMVFIPFMPIPQIDALIALVGMYNATNTIIAVAYQSMMGEIIPVSYRNRVFAQRNIWTGVSGMAVALIAGYGIDKVPYPYGYQTSFTIGFIFSLVETWYFHKLRIPSEEEEPEKASPKPAEVEQQLAHAQHEESNQSAGSKVLSPLLRRFAFRAGWPFYLFCGSSIVFIFAWQMAWPIYTKVKVDTLHATNTMISVDTVLGGVGSLIAFQLWAQMADRRGNGLTMFVSALMLALTPYLWMYAPSMIWVILYDFIGGIVTGGFNQSMFNRLLEIVPENARQRAIALYTTLSQVSAIFAPIVGMQLFGAVPYKACMALIGTSRVIGALCFLIILLPFPLWLKKRKRSNESAAG